jgi:guanine deaminase
MNKFIRAAIKEAEKGVRLGHGGPFGAVIVKDGKIISRGHNDVIFKNDPTNHAEMTAIRRAAKKMGTFDLSDCEIYITCEPCPMCLGAVHWAKMRKMTYGCSRSDAAKIGFDDKFIYDVILGKAKKKQVAVKQEEREECLKVFKKFEEKKGKKMY